MIPPQTGNYRAALAAPHQAYSRVEVWHSGVLVEELNQLQVYDGRPTLRPPIFIGGSVRATLASRVARTLTLSVPDYLYPFEETDLLNPYGPELRVYRGIRYGSGAVDEFPIFAGPIRSVSPTGNGTATVSAADRASLVVSNGFAAPRRADVGATVLSEFQQLILDALPSATFGTSDDITETVPELSYDYDRAAALDGLAKMGGAFWYALAGGDFVLRRVPWTVNLTRQPITMSDGDGGTVETAYPNRTRDDLFNRITVTSERADGSAPVFATADDTDPTSPTYVSGAFGVQAAQVRVTQAASQGAAGAAARTLIARSKARTESWRISCVPDGSIELGDPLQLLVRGRDVLQLVASYSIPLDPEGKMAIDGRALVSTEVSA